MPKVLIADTMSDIAAQVFIANGIDTVVATGLGADALAAELADVDGLVVRSSTRVTAELLAAADALKVVGRAGSGVDNVDVAAATARGVVVMNAPFGNAITTAEHAIAMIMALARRCPAADASTRACIWEKSRFVGADVAG